MLLKESFYNIFPTLWKFVMWICLQWVNDKTFFPCGSGNLKTIYVYLGYKRWKRESLFAWTWNIQLCCCQSEAPRNETIAEEVYVSVCSSFSCYEHIFCWEIYTKRVELFWREGQERKHKRSNQTVMKVLQVLTVTENFFQSEFREFFRQENFFVVYKT